MIDFFKFRENLAEAKKRGVNEERGYIAVHVKKGTTEVYANTSYEAAKAAAKKWGLRSTSGIDVYLAEAKKHKVKEQDLEKGADDPCWDGYVQVGTKMKDGKEVPNCVPMDEAKKMKNEAIKESVELVEQPQSGDKEAYTKFFNAALKRFGADSIADMDDDKKKEFFTYVDKNWESEDEKNEYFQLDEKTVPLNKLRRGRTYTVNMGGKKGKVKVDSIRIDGGDVYVKMTYMDNNIGKKGETDTRGFDQGGDDDVFMERYK